jgi:hypothetical protein
MSGEKVQKYKYDFSEFKSDSTKALPADINDVLRVAVSPLGCNELTSLIDTIQKKRMYGCVFVLDDRGIQISKIDFQSGICQKYDIAMNPENPVIRKPIHALFLRSERNVMVSFRKNNPFKGRLIDDAQE